MRSRATFTKLRPVDWRTWVLADYARYWYAVGVAALLVFGVGELARIGSPLSGLEFVALLLVVALILVAGIAGYDLLWRRDRPLAQLVLRGFHRLRGSLVKALGLQAQTADSPSSPPKDSAQGEQHGPG